MVDKNYIIQLIENKLSGTEQFLVDVKLSPGRLAVFIDKPAGITIGECSALSRSLINDLEPTGFLDAHEIEVSSPGMDQPLKNYKQYLRRIGREVKVTTAEGKQHKGKLLSANENGFELLEIIQVKQDRKKIKQEINHKLNYNQVKETTLDF
ncbi:MAG TPA: ribosome assembly cofactor RimP [Bacteroidia bacterium]|nr:ribosome assembly cofactor RimP [Bacteroidia bacterium]